jgi:hypothetical protein
MRLRSRDLFQTVHTEGGLLPADLLQRVADGDRTLDGLAPSDYHLDPGERLNERITRAWTRLTSAWRAFDDARRAPGAVADSSGKATREQWLQILFDELGYGRLVQKPAIEIDEKQYPIFSQWLNTPIHLVGAGISLDQRTAGVRGAAGQSPHSLTQELLNRSQARLWGIVSNGLILRILRDNVSLTRQAYVQFDLEAMFTGEVYSDFVLLWLLCHQSRVEAEKPGDCWLERWTKAAADTGTRALDALRQGVEEAIETLGAGFLAHPANKHLHEQLAGGELEPLDYYRILLRLVYRLLVLFVAEDRGALLDPGADQIAKDRYRAHYSTAHLRVLASKRRGGRHHDRYEQLKLVTTALHEQGQPALALPALGSYLWEPSAIGPLAEAQLANEDLFAAIRSLATVEQNNIPRAVDFRNLGAEELGSVYESLLELHPTINRDTRGFKLESVSGSERKTTGSYYTPSSLISSLLDSALEPVLDEAARGDDPQQAILKLAVVDPACGSGHFLIAAANRIAKRLAAVRSEDPEPSPGETRAALRDVIGHCIHGVDMNPMAVELCKVSLWMEALEPGRPLSFLDHKIVLGNSLLGTTPELIAGGIPADAFKPILGDDKKVVTALRRRNAQEQSGQLSLDMTGDRVDADAHAIAAQAAKVAAVDDRSLSGVREQQQRFQQLLNSPERRRAQLAADTWCAAFVALKNTDSSPVTQDTLSRVLSGGDAGLSPEELAVVATATGRYSFVHWHVAFPDIWERGGFDAVLGNPPWERVKLQEKEFFATRSPAIANAPNAAARRRLIAALADEDPALLQAFEDAKREAEGASHLIRDSGRYPLCGVGDVNTYAVFSELMWRVLGPRGRSGIIVPTGIATDDTTKRFFQAIVEERSIHSLLGFYDRKQIFTSADVHGFCLLTTTGPSLNVDEPEFMFNARSVDELNDPEKRFTLTAEDIELLNPNTRTCPVFRTRRDAEITKGIYRRVPVLIRDGDPNGNPWGIKFSTMFHMSNDSHLFRTRDQLEAEGYVLDGNVFVRLESSGGADSAVSADSWLPLYEAKMIHHYDPRWATYEGDGTVRDVTAAEKADSSFAPLPRYWVSAAEVDVRLGGWIHDRLLGWREVARNTDERTVIGAVIPRVGVGHKYQLAFPADPDNIDLLAACLSSFVFDFVARQKLGGTAMSYFVLKQLPVPAPHDVRAALLGIDLRAPDRAELDARMFRLYGLSDDDVIHVLDSFPVVARREMAVYGEYRSRRLILEARRRGTRIPGAV